MHATVAGVLAALAIPLCSKLDEDELVDNLKQLSLRLESTCRVKTRFLSEEKLEILEEIKRTSTRAEPPLQRLEYFLGPLVSFLIMPLFALANAGVAVEGSILSLLLHPVSLGVMVGLVTGKFVGVSLATYLTTRLGWAELPAATSWAQLYGVAMLAGIGFTMSLFVTDLAFAEASLAAYAKVGILAASLVATLLGLLILFMARPEEE
ncbi:MAG: Na+/H+ antiporter NhaA [Bacteroidia bacterium]|nr:Na+/H+ antiporter NhaA [Bacteroidia bacterium]